MASVALAFGLLAVAAASAPQDAHPALGAAGAERSKSLLQTWGKTLDGASAGTNDTPVTRVVSLLKEMANTLKTEQEEDEALYDKLACWCYNNNYEKGQAISEAGAKVEELQSTIEGLTAKSARLETSIKELNAEVAADKQALAEAIAMREKQAAEFHGAEMDSVQAIANLKAALAVLAKHHEVDEDSTVEGGPIFKTDKDQWSLLSVKQSGLFKDEPWTSNHEETRMEHSLEDFMRRNGYDDAPRAASGRAALPKSLRKPGGGALTQAGGAAQTPGWSPEEAALVQRALRSASAFVQRHGGQYYPAYSSSSGQIVGILNQLKEEMEADLGESQKTEIARAAAFEELRAAKTAEIQNGEKMAEHQEDELATAKNALAEAKEDLEQTQGALSEDQKFMANLKKTCNEAATNFQARKSERLQEIQAVSETIEILTADEARDAVAGTYSFLQGSSQANHESQGRHEAAQVLRRTAKSSKDPQLSILATAVELDAFTKVKKAIDDMIAMLKVQQADEVKRSDYCKSELQENEMTTAKAEDHKAGLEAKYGVLESSLKALEDGISAAKEQIAQLQLELQRASENRKVENLDFQKVVADQTTTIEVLRTALDRLAAYYDKEALLQRAKQARASAHAVQTPPVPQMEFKPSQGGAGVMQMLEKLIQEAKGMTADAIKSESSAQAAYEETVADTNSAVLALQGEILSKSKAEATAKKDKLRTENEVSDTVIELEGLTKYNIELHADCDYVLKNFGTRQAAREQEIEALQEAKQILSGASLS